MSMYNIYKCHTCTMSKHVHVFYCLLQCCDLQRCVISPLSVLLELFHDPVLLMSKRRSKLLDYDSLQHDLEKTTEPDKLEPLREQVTLAKRSAVTSPVNSSYITIINKTLCSLSYG